MICNSPSETGRYRCSLDDGHFGPHHDLDYRCDFVREDEHCVACGLAAAEHYDGNAVEWRCPPRFIDGVRLLEIAR